MYPKISLILRMVFKLLTQFKSIKGIRQKNRVKLKYFEVL